MIYIVMYSQDQFDYHECFMSLKFSEFTRNTSLKIMNLSSHRSCQKKMISSLHYLCSVGHLLHSSHDDSDTEMIHVCCYKLPSPECHSYVVQWYTRQYLRRERIKEQKVTHWATIVALFMQLGGVSHNFPNLCQALIPWSTPENIRYITPSINPAWEGWTAAALEAWLLDQCARRFNAQEKGKLKTCVLLYEAQS